jgi:hypothetical protein
VFLLKVIASHEDQVCLLGEKSVEHASLIFPDVIRLKICNQGDPDWMMQFWRSNGDMGDFEPVRFDEEGVRGDGQEQRSANGGKGGEPGGILPQRGSLAGKKDHAMKKDRIAQESESPEYILTQQSGENAGAQAPPRQGKDGHGDGRSLHGGPDHERVRNKEQSVVD